MAAVPDIVVKVKLDVQDAGVLEAIAGIVRQELDRLLRNALARP